MKQVRLNMVEDRLINVRSTDEGNAYYLHHLGYPEGLPIESRGYNDPVVLPGVWLLLDERRARFRVFTNLGPKSIYDHSLARMLTEFPSLRRAYSYEVGSRVEYEFTLPEEFVHFRLLWTRVR
ncbi:MAG: hypothetical protein EOP83_33315 [Verrucomicrobiaceae bacterium]|nr:MAG: hypothetical protein EOP83_33315 [Verrucomicrobiaceae bacterium]